MLMYGSDMIDVPSPLNDYLSRIGATVALLLVDDAIEVTSLRIDDSFQLNLVNLNRSLSLYRFAFSAFHLSMIMNYLN